jgi:ABC-type uncharacterized transport system permease subunit
MDWIVILQAGVASGTVLLFATIGEILAERSGVMNLGVEGMMLMGAMAAFSVAVSTGNPWLGLLLAMVVGGLLALLHGVVTIHFQADQVVSGLTLTFLGTGLALVFGEGLSKAGAISLLPTVTLPLLSRIPILGPILFTNQSVLVYAGYLFVPAAWFYINRTRPGLHLRAVGEFPAAADALGISVYRQRYLYVCVGGVLAGLAGATISLAISPGWFSEMTTSGQGWIAIGLVIFAQWDPLRAAGGAYAFGALRRLILDLQGPTTLLGLRNPFFYNSYLGFFLQMLPYAFTIVVLIIGSREAMRKRLGAPAALGIPYVREQKV